LEKKYKEPEMVYITQRFFEAEDGTLFKKKKDAIQYNLNQKLKELHF